MFVCGIISTLKASSHNTLHKGLNSSDCTVSFSSETGNRLDEIADAMMEAVRLPSLHADNSRICHLRVDVNNKPTPTSACKRKSRRLKTRTLRDILSSRTGPSQARMDNASGRRWSRTPWCFAWFKGSGKCGPKRRWTTLARKPMESRSGATMTSDTGTRPTTTETWVGF